MDKMNTGFENCRQDDSECVGNVTENILADSFKIKYFFKEQMDKNLI